MTVGQAVQTSETSKFSTVLVSSHKEYMKIIYTYKIYITDIMCS